MSDRLLSLRLILTDGVYRALASELANEVLDGRMTRRQAMEALAAYRRAMAGARP